MVVETITGCHSIDKSEVLRMLISLAICSSLVWTTNYTSDVCSQTHAYINIYHNYKQIIYIRILHNMHIHIRIKMLSVK